MTVCRHRGLDTFAVLHSEFLEAFLEVLMKIHPIDDVAGSVDCFSSPYERRVVFSKHRSSHLDEGLVLPFDDSILLRSIWSIKLMSDARLIEEFLYTSVFEYGAVVASDVLDLQAIVFHDALGEAFEDSLSL